MASFPTDKVNALDSDKAFAAYQALQMAEKAEPTLVANPYWNALIDTAYARFCATFEVVK